MNRSEQIPRMSREHPLAGEQVGAVADGVAEQALAASEPPQPELVDRDRAQGEVDDRGRQAGVADVHGAEEDRQQRPVEDVGLRGQVKRPGAEDGAVWR